MIYDEKTMAPLNDVVGCLKTLIIQMQAINDHLSWWAKNEKANFWTADMGYRIRCSDCRGMYKYVPDVQNAADLISGICDACRKKSYQECYKIREDAGTVGKSEKFLHDKYYNSEYEEKRKKELEELKSNMDKVHQEITHLRQMVEDGKMTADQLEEFLNKKI